MSKEIKEFDERGNVVYEKNKDGYEFLSEYDERNNCVYYNISIGYICWREYDENNRMIYIRDNIVMKGYPEASYYKYDENNKQIDISKKEFEWIEFKKKEKEFNSRTKVSRFRLMDI